MEYLIPFNKPYITGLENINISKILNTGKLAGNGEFTKKCQNYFEGKYGFNKCLLTTSCTDALEMASILIDINVGDEVILPSYTFVSSANPFLLRGAKLKFIDSKSLHPSMDEELIESQINEKTKAILIVHYAGTACNMDLIMKIANKYNLFVIEDAAQAIDNYFIYPNGNKKPLGSFGHLAAFSFHETKNIISGEGGLLVINDKKLSDRAETIWEKGTNRNAFFKGKVDKYNWVDIGSSFLPSELIAGFLFAQLCNIDKIQKKRIEQWQYYYNGLKKWAFDNNILIPIIPNYSTNNAHIFYLVFQEESTRDEVINKLKEEKIMSVFHYLSLHNSPYFKNLHDGRILKNSDKFSSSLLRLPLYYELEKKHQDKIIEIIKK